MSIKFSVAILAGGKSSRMGTDKAFVSLLGKPLIEHLLDRLLDLGQSETLLITNRPDDYAHLGLPMLTDLLPGKAALGGIYTALHYSDNPYTVVVACDMPFVNPALLGYMIDLCAEDEPDILAPRVDGYPQGLHAIYSKSCMPAIRARLDTNRLKVAAFYSSMRVRYLDEPEYQRLDPTGLSFSNINTPEELKTAQQLASKIKGD